MPDDQKVGYLEDSISYWQSKLEEGGLNQEFSIMASQTIEAHSKLLESIQNSSNNG